MADGKQLRKGILKSSSSFEKTESYRCSSAKEMKWDEMNILQTLHPADKDYGHMKIEEPKTPYSHYKDPDEMQVGNVEPHSDDETDSFDANLLAKKIQLGSNKLPKALEENDDDEDEDDDDEFENETEEEREKRKYFEQKRKLHYNEFYAVKLARKLMEKEEDNDEVDEDDEEDATKDEKSETNKQSPNSKTTETESCNQSDNLS